MAGFTWATSLDVTIEDSQLDIRGRQNRTPHPPVLHRGIAASKFSRVFVLADGIEVAGAELKDGRLAIDLARFEPEREDPPDRRPPPASDPLVRPFHRSRQEASARRFRGASHGSSYRHASYRRRPRVRPDRRVGHRSSAEMSSEDLVCAFPAPRTAAGSALCGVDRRRRRADHGRRRPRLALESSANTIWCWFSLH